MGDLVTFLEVCEALSISAATGRNWLRLGKLTPVKRQGGRMYFARADVESVLRAVTTGKSNALNRRRNKKKVNKLSLYESYVSSPENREVIGGIIQDFGTSLTEATVRALLANFALQLICEKTGRPFSQANLVRDFLSVRFSVFEFDPLISALLAETDLQGVDLTSPLFEHRLRYVEDDDTLGFAYISLVNLGLRKAQGTYYTPLKVVRKLVTHLKNTVDLAGKTIFDPCCGSGNFLLEIGKHTTTPELLYGQDLDPVAIYLARISFALKFELVDLDFLYSHFICADAFNQLPLDTFDLVIGNPPWGGEIPEKQKEELARKFKTAQARSIETFSLFTEHALTLLPDKGVLAFVLPEAILNVRAHKKIRSILLEQCNFKFVHYLGEVFSGVYCPSIILGVEKSRERMPGVTQVCVADNSYSLTSNRQLSAERFNFRVTDARQDCLEALTNRVPITTLHKQAKFALGIVTGDNATYTSTAHQPGWEPVLKGSNIKKFRYEPAEIFIKFEPEKFQQVAPSELYRAPEKLLYRFICDSLVFAYDDKQTLSLNSCNILIPQIPDLQIKYILAILNSRAATFYTANMFSSVKVLRSHLEWLPIPVVGEKEQCRIITLVDRLLLATDQMADTYEELDQLIMDLYQLNLKEQQLIRDFLARRNLFLK